MKRLIFSILAGIACTLGLFWLMQAMVMNNQKGFKKTDNLQMVEFVRLKRDEQAKTQERKLKKQPPPPEKKPPPPKMQMQTPQAHVRPMAQPNMNIPNLDIPVQSNRFSTSILTGLTAAKGPVTETSAATQAPTPTASTEGVPEGTGTISTNVIPLVRIPPRYPGRAAQRRIEGSVTIEFTITKNGTVTDAVVVEAKPSSVFNNAALQAIRKWKFKAKIVNGKAYEQRARQTLQFKLSR